MGKQTAVEWLAERIQSDKIFSLKNVIEQAKTMEREQIVDAWHDGRSPYGHFFVGNYLENTYGKEASHEL